MDTALFCFVYSKDTDRPCFQPAVVQGVCQDHAVLCRVCKEDTSARGVCENCMSGALREKMELEQLLTPGKACAVCEQAPVYLTPSGTLCPRCGGGVDLIDVSAEPPAPPAGPDGDVREPMDPDGNAAEAQGAAAFREGLPSGANPYADPFYRDAWNTGWTAAQRLAAPPPAPPPALAPGRRRGASGAV